MGFWDRVKNVLRVDKGMEPEEGGTPRDCGAVMPTGDPFCRVDLNKNAECIADGIQCARNGNNPEYSQAADLPEGKVAFRICNAIGSALSGNHLTDDIIAKAGGEVALYNQMYQDACRLASSFGSTEVSNYVGSPVDAVRNMRIKANENKLKSRTKPDVRREAQLNQIFNTTKARLDEFPNREFATNEDYVLAGAEKRSAMPIKCGEPTAAIERYDLKAAIQLALAEKDGKICMNDIQKLGGAAYVIDVMSTRAETQALKKGWDLKDIPDMVSNYFESPQDIIAAMNKQRVAGR